MSNLVNDALKAWIAENWPYAQYACYFVCGPGGINATVATLAGIDMPGGRIAMECYGGAVESDDTVAGVSSMAAIVFRGRRHDVPVAAGQTVLASARTVRVDAPYSCEAVVCGAYHAELAGGSVHMQAKIALRKVIVDAGDAADGLP